jgi:hypothetical protein
MLLVKLLFTALKQRLYLIPISPAHLGKFVNNFLGTGYREQGTGNRLQVTGNREQGTGNREQVTGYREQGTGDREQGTGKREEVTGYREQGTGDREQVTGYREQGTGDREQGRGFGQLYFSLLFVTYVGFFPFTYLNNQIVDI